MYSWRRPDYVPYPTVWRRAAGRKPVDGKIPSFIIQDVPKDREEDVKDFMEQHFVKNEPLSQCVGHSDDEVSVKECRDLWKQLLVQRITVVAFLENDGPRPRIAGANVLGVVTRDDEKKVKPESLGEAEKKIICFLDSLYAMADPFETYGVEEYITAMGLSVAKEFQGQGLGKELLKARFDVGRAVGVKLTVTSFTAIESQVLATREGFEELARIKYADYKIGGKEVFPGINSEYALLMAKRIE